MAYNSYYPVTYQPNFYAGGNPYYAQNYQQNQNSQQIQQTGFVSVQSEAEARSYPVALGNSITFNDENAPYCYVKTMGFSQLDRPTFEKYRLVKEDSALTAQNGSETADAKDDKDTGYALKTDLSAIWGEIDTLKEKIADMGEKKIVKVRKRIESDDDDE